MIKVLPETKDNLLVIEATGKLTTKDYEEVFIPKLQELIDKYTKIRVLMYLPTEFVGWELGAMWDDAKFGFRHRNDFEKIALAGGPSWVKWATNVFSHLLKCDVKTFNDIEFKKALEWLK